MKQIDLNNKKDLLRLKESLNTIIENKINAASTKACCERVSSLSFGELKNIFESICDKLYETENGKRLIAKYVKTIRENKNIRTEYSIYEALRKPSYITNPSTYVYEAIKISEGINGKALKEESDKIRQIVKQCISEAALVEKDFDRIIEENKIFNDSFNTIINTKKNAHNLASIVNCFESIKEHVSSTAPKEPILETKESVKDLVKKLTESLSSENYWENKVTKDIVLGLLGNNNKSEIFETYKSSCITKIDSILKNDNTLENKSQLSNMKTQLEGKEYCEDTLMEDLLKLAELENTLTD